MPLIIAPFIRERPPIIIYEIYVTNPLFWWKKMLSGSSRFVATLQLIGYFHQDFLFVGWTNE
jgi:hypothetical protein